MIESTLIAHVVDGRKYFIYDTVIGGKHVYTACGVGRVVNGDVSLTPVGKATLSALLAYVQDLQGDGFTALFVEIARISKAAAKVGTALEASNSEGVVFFVCHDLDIYHAAIAALQGKGGAVYAREGANARH